MNTETFIEEIKFIQIVDEELEAIEELDRKPLHALGLPESDYDRNIRLLKKVGAYKPGPLFSNHLLTEQGKKLFK